VTHVALGEPDVFSHLDQAKIRMAKTVATAPVVH